MKYVPSGDYPLVSLEISLTSIVGVGDEIVAPNPEIQNLLNSKGIEELTETGGWWLFRYQKPRVTFRIEAYKKTIIEPINDIAKKNGVTIVGSPSEFMLEGIVSMPSKMKENYSGFFRDLEKHFLTVYGIDIHMPKYLADPETYDPVKNPQDLHFYPYTKQWYPSAPNLPYE